MTKVYAPQLPSRFDKATRLWIPIMDMRPAEKYGELHVLLPPNAGRLGTVPLAQTLREKMDGFTVDDYLIAIGDPTLIAAAAIIAQRKTGGPIKMLKWDRNANDYLSTEIKV